MGHVPIQPGGRYPRGHRPRADFAGSARSSPRDWLLAVGVDRPAADHGSELSAHATGRVGIVAVRRGDLTDASGGPVRPRCCRSWRATGAAIPPRLYGELTDRSGLVSAGQRRAAGAKWVGWWQAVLAHHVGLHQGPPDGADQRAWLARQAVQAGTLFDPPDFAALAGRSALRDVLRTTSADALRWARQPAPHLADAAPRAPRPVRIRDRPIGRRTGRTTTPSEPGRCARLRHCAARRGQLVAT